MFSWDYGQKFSRVRVTIAAREVIWGIGDWAVVSQVHMLDELHGSWIVTSMESSVSSCFKQTKCCQGHLRRSWYGADSTINACTHVFNPSTSISNISTHPRSSEVKLFAASIIILLFTLTEAPTSFHKSSLINTISKPPSSSTSSSFFPFTITFNSRNGSANSTWNSDTLAVVWEVQCTKTKLIIVSWGWVWFGCYSNIWQLLGVHGVRSGNHNTQKPSMRWLEMGIGWYCLL